MTQHHLDLHGSAIFFAVILGAAAAVRAGVIATETFESYSAGSNNLQGNNGGTGWAANWLAPATTSVLADVVNTTNAPLSFSPVGGVVIGGATRAGQGWSSVNGTTGNNPVAARQLSTPLASTFYIRYLLQYSNTNSPAQNNFGGNNTFSLHLAGTATDTATLNFGIRNPGSGQAATVMLRNGTGAPVAGASAAKPVVAGQTHLLVAKLTYSGGAFNQIDLWYDPAYGDSNSTPTVTLTSASLASISYIFFRSAANDSDDRYLFDNLLLGTTWDDVVPPQVALPIINSFSLMYPGNAGPVPGYDPITNNAIINLFQTGTNLSIRANTTPASDFGSVVFNLTGATAHAQTENSYPWALFGDSGAGYTGADFNIGAHNLAATPYTADAAGGTAGNATNVNFTTVNTPVNVPPATSITNPLNAATLPAPANILIQAIAADSDGSVTNVEFFAGATKLGAKAAPPYSFLWTNVPPGAYSLTTRAADNEGAIGISAAINISVLNINIEKWHPVDLSFTSTNIYSNPFQNVSLSATFTKSGSPSITVPGFYAGSQIWKVRFSATAEGTWNYTTTSSDPSLNGKTGAISCSPNSNPKVHGGLLVDSNHPHYFIYEDGTPHFLLSFEADWLALMDFGDTNITKAKSLIDIYRAQGFNRVIMNVYAYDTSWKSGLTSTNDFGPPTQYAWLGSNASPDHSQMNTAFFDNFDQVIDYLFQNGITAHVFFKVNNKGVNWPAVGSTNENLYFTYVTARYQAYPNMVWDFEKEAKNDPSGNTYVNNSIITIKNSDAYHRLMTVHDDLSYYSAFPDTCDFQTIQADGTPLYSTLIGDRNTKNWPVFESEYDYQIGNDGGHTYSHFSDKTVVLQNTLECLMAGCGANYYYTYHAWDVCRYNETPVGLNAYQNLVNFFAGTSWNTLVPNEGLINSAGIGRHCLAIPGSEYVVYLGTNSSTVTLTISGAPAGNSLVTLWFDPVTGASQSLTNTGNGAKIFTNPWPDPALLHLALPPAAPTGLTAVPGDSQVVLNWAAASNATSYKVKRSTISGGSYTVVTTNTSLTFTNSGLVNGTLYYFVVSGLNSIAESTNSAEVSARPTSNTATTLNASINANQVQLDWPVDHTGYRLQMQTNSPGSGLGTNWITVVNSISTNQMNFPISTTNGSVFFRLIYP